MFEINLLGPGQVRYQGKAITGFPVQQHCLLFYYLLLNRKSPQTREQIAAVFWAESSASLARKHLRNTLWRLSQALRAVGASLEALISVQEDYIFFTSSSEYWLDIDEFEAALHHSQDQASQGLNPEQVSLLEKGVELYRGDLLEGVYEDWCLYDRERLRLGFLNMLIKLMNHYGHQGNYQRGLEYGHRILSLDPTRERVHRQMMMFHWLAGDRETALAQYRACRELLHNELGLEPMQETRHLYETILRSSASPDKYRLNDMEHLNASANIASEPPLREMLQKLHFLKLIVEQTNSELRLLERMIQQVLDVK